MARYKKNTKECSFCGTRKHKRYFRKGKNYCLTCWRLYFKHLTKESDSHNRGMERRNLEKLGKVMFKDNHLYRIYLQNVIRNHPKRFKQIRKYIREYGVKPHRVIRIESILEYCNS